LTRFAKYDPKQESPLEAVGKWPKDLPLGIIRSRVDTIVGPDCTKPLLKNYTRSSWKIVIMPICPMVMSMIVNLMRIISTLLWHVRH